MPIVTHPRERQTVRNGRGSHINERDEAFGYITASLDSIKEDVTEIKQDVKILNEDYIARKSANKIILAVVSAVSAGIAILIESLIALFGH